VVTVERVAANGTEASRNSSRSRPNSRLQDRLAKAVNKGADKGDARASSDFGSRPESPALPAASAATGAEEATPSLDVEPPGPVADLPSPGSTGGAVKAESGQPDASPRPSTDAAAPAPVQTPPILSPRLVSEQPASAQIPAMSMPSILSPRTASPRPSFDSDVSRPSFDAPSIAEPATRDPDVLLTELSALQEAHEETVRSHREELNGHLERIDALQSKLTYLAQQLATSAKAATSDAATTPADKKLAEKDAQIAALLEEGQRLSKTEMKHLTTVKALRAKALEHNKDITTLKQRLSKAEKSITEQSERAKRAEAAERGAQDKLKIVGKIEKDLELIRSEREEAGMTIAELRRQLNDALSRAESAEKRVQSGALEAEKRATASLKEDMDNMRIEKKLAEDRAKRELQSAREEAKNQQEKSNVAELELRGEIAVSQRCTILQVVTDMESRTWNPSLSCSAPVQRKRLRQRPVIHKLSFCGRSKRYKPSTPLLRRTGRALRLLSHLA
jgi:hypothetical protein